MADLQITITCGKVREIVTGASNKGGQIGRGPASFSVQCAGVYGTNGQLAPCGNRVMSTSDADSPYSALP